MGVDDTTILALPERKTNSKDAKEERKGRYGDRG
jgi:hypothetical protein